MKLYGIPHCLAWLIVLNALVAGNLRAQSPGSYDPSLKLHFDFDEDFSHGEVMDVSGNGNNGWQFNPTNWITATNGVFGTTAAQFTYVGVLTNDPPAVLKFSQYIVVTNLAGIAYLTNGTISVWAKFDDTNDANLVSLLDSGFSTMYVQNPSQASNSWTFGRDFASYLSFWVYPNNGGAQTLVRWPDDTVQPGGFHQNLSTTNFHLYTITIDCPNNQAIAYYDGQPYMANTVGVPWIKIYGCASVQWLCIGALAHDGTPQWGDDPYPNDGYLYGRLDDIRIYNRTLSAAEVQALYTGSAFALNPSIQRTDPQSVQLCWDTSTNVSYQVEYRTDFNTNTWTALGSPSFGTGAADCIIDSTFEQVMRFYRVRILP